MSAALAVLAVGLFVVIVRALFTRALPAPPRPPGAVWDAERKRWLTPLDALRERFATTDMDVDDFEAEVESILRTGRERPAVTDADRTAAEALLWLHANATERHARAMTSKAPASSYRSPAHSEALAARISDGTADYERIDVIGGDSFYVEV